MSRSALFLLLCSLAGSTLSGCGEAEDLSAYQNRNPAMRTLRYGHVLAVGQPTSAYISGVVAGDDRAFVQYGRSTSNSCLRVAIYRIEDVEADLKTPHQWISACDEGIRANAFSRLSYAEGTLMAGANLFVADGDGTLQFQSDLGALLPVIDDLQNVKVLGASQVLLATRDTAYLMERQGDSWVNTARLANGGLSRLDASGDFLLVGAYVYQLQQGAWASIYESRAPLALEGDRILSGTTFVGVFDGTTFTGPGSVSGPYRKETYLLPGGLLYTTNEGDLVLANDDFSDPLPDRLDEGKYDIDAVSLFGNHVLLATSTIAWDGNNGRQTTRVHWLRIGERDAQGEVLSESVSLERNDVANHSFTVRPGARQLTIELQGTGDADLYVRRGARPTRTQWDCSPYRMGSAEVCSFPQPEAGEWFVDVVGFDASSDVLVTATID